jgi:hypothetical protein
MERRRCEDGDRRLRHREGGDGFVPPAERIEVFDNDGTLWCDESDVQVLIAGLVQAFAGMGVDEYAEGAHAFLTGAGRPTLGLTG